MRGKTKFKILILIAIITFTILTQNSNFPAKAETQTEIRIFGLVENPLRLTKDELLSLPMISEIVTLKCVFGIPTETFNWTGIPLFHLLTLAQVKPEALEVVFRAPDGFSSSLPIQDALEPYVILAVMANGTLLSQTDWIAENVQGGFRIVVPCKYGYKWVAYVNEIEVVDYDYNGTYETMFGYTEEDAKIPDCVPPSINPPLQEFTLQYGTRTFEVETFTNASIAAFNFNYLQKEIEFNIIVPSETTSFVNLIIPNAFLKEPYTVYLDENEADFTAANVIDYSFLYLLSREGLHTVRIRGTEFFGAIPEITVEFDEIVFVDEIVAFNASQSVDDGQIVLFSWDFGDGSNGTGPVVYHSYSKEGVYNVLLNVTDNDGLSNYKVLTVIVQRQPQYIPLVLKTVLIAIFALLIFMFLILLIKKRSPKDNIEHQTTTYIEFSFLFFHF